MSDKQRQEQQRIAGTNGLPFAIPGSLSPFFDIIPSSPQDAVAFAKVWLDSFATDSRNTFWWSTDHNIMVGWIGRRMIRKMRDSEVRHFKVIEITTGGVVAFARWTLPKDGHEVYGEWIAPHEPGDELAEDPGAGASGIASTVEIAAGPLVCPTGADSTACRIFFDALGRASNKWVTPTTLGGCSNINPKSLPR
ncbi:hypothetical protein H072_8249 [Dactylellina haptotyla CBS 200.50]|uniref:N-acetyltransferase domain-containing protein n=1 Tax=Dactylellina haptotyla (strain CBS 200.50) TaxID=1284197 RepID=S8BS25_DACHA|nr:hypothetical protein H072_8249 [Dactylellina haptotyla CBS 200.50]